MTAPAWLAATSGQVPLAGQVNQFLVSHATTYVYTGVQQASSTTVGTGSVTSTSLYAAQSFTTSASQTTTGYVNLWVSVTGTPPPLTVSLQASVSGAPSGTPLSSVQLPMEFLSSVASVPVVILPTSGLSASVTYWIVMSAAGDLFDYYSLYKSTQTSGTSTSPDGVTWTPQSYGLLYRVWDGTPGGALTGTWEDSGARWSSYGYSGGRLASIRDFTAGQTAAGYAASSRALSYTSGQLTGVA